MQLLNLLPTEGGYEALKTIRRQKEMLSFDQEEIKLLGMKSVTNPDGSVKTTWNNDNIAKVVKDVPIDEYMTNHFRKRLAEIEKEGRLNEQLMSLYEKFVIMFK